MQSMSTGVSAAICSMSRLKLAVSPSSCSKVRSPAARNTVKQPAAPLEQCQLDLRHEAGRGAPAQEESSAQQRHERHRDRDADGRRAGVERRLVDQCQLTGSGQRRQGQHEQRNGYGPAARRVEQR